MPGDYNGVANQQTSYPGGSGPKSTTDVGFTIDPDGGEITFKYEQEGPGSSSSAIWCTFTIFEPDIAVSSPPSHDIFITKDGFSMTLTPLKNGPHGEPRYSGSYSFPVEGGGTVTGTFGPNSPLTGPATKEVVAPPKNVAAAVTSTIVGVYSGTLYAPFEQQQTAPFTLTLRQTSANALRANMVFTSDIGTIGYSFAATPTSVTAFSAAPFDGASATKLSGAVSSGVLHGFWNFALPKTPDDNIQYSATPATAIAGNVSLTKGKGPLAGVTITLQPLRAHKPHGKAITTTTDPLGNYAFVGIKAGSYSITQTPPKKYKLSSPATPYIVSVSSGHSLATENFTDRKT